MSPSNVASLELNVSDGSFSQEVAEHYYQALLELKVPDRIYITTLTEIAIDNASNFLKETIYAIEQRIQHAPRKEKLPAWYLIDSIVKSGSATSYKAAFASRLPRLIVQHMDLDDPLLSEAFTELLSVWHTIFPAEMFREVERLIGEAVAASSGSSGGKGPTIPHQPGAAVTSAPIIPNGQPADALLDENLTVVLTELVRSLTNAGATPAPPPPLPIRAASLPSPPVPGALPAAPRGPAPAGPPRPPTPLMDSTTTASSTATSSSRNLQALPASFGVAGGNSRSRLGQLVSSLYSKKQACPQCGQRFDTMAELVGHKDRHFSTSWKSKATSRRWALRAEDWAALSLVSSSYEAVAPLADILEEKPRPPKRSFGSVVSAELTSAASAPDVVLSRGDDREYRCCVCDELMGKHLDDAVGEWTLVDSVHVTKGASTVVCHKRCSYFLPQGSVLATPAAKTARLHGPP